MIDDFFLRVGCYLVCVYSLDIPHFTMAPPLQNLMFDKFQIQVGFNLSICFGIYIAA